ILYLASILSLLRPVPTSTLFPYTTLFRSNVPRFSAPDVRSVVWDYLVVRTTTVPLSRGWIQQCVIRGSWQHARGRHLDLSSLPEDRKSTRLNSSHEWISYAVFCLKKKKRQ